MPKLLKQLINHILCGDALTILKEFQDNSIDCVITSPPYWALRDYGVEGQLGLESSFQAYISKLCDVFDEVKRVLKENGTCWVVLGDTYSTRGGKPGNWSQYSQSKNASRVIGSAHHRRPSTDVSGKCLLMIPSRFAIEMINRGWILRNELIWWKPNCMPSSAKDRFTVDFEKVFFFVKNRKYFFRQQFEPLQDKARLKRRAINPHSNMKRLYGDKYILVINPKTAEASRKRTLARGRNMRAVWIVATRPFPGKHFAVYPPDLIETPIKAGCRKGGIVLDPFIGSGTTALVAKKLGRQFIGIDLNPQYVQQARKRLSREQW